MDLIQSSLRIWIAKIANSILIFVGLAFFARVLGPAQLGVYFLFEVLIGLLAIPADFGLRGAVEKRMSEGGARDQILSTGVVLKSILLSVIILFILAFAGEINNYVGESIVWYVILGLILHESALFMDGAVRGEMRAGETAILQFSNQTTWVLASSVFVLYGFGAKALIYGHLIGLSMMLSLGIYLSSTSLTRPTIKQSESLISYSKYNALAQTDAYAYNWMDVAVIGLFLSQVQVGAYEVAWRVSLVVILLSQAIETTIFPQVSAWEAQGKSEQIRELIQNALLPSLYLVFPAFFGVILLSDEILTLLFGPEYAIAGLVLVILMADKIFQTARGVFAHTLMGLNHPNLVARIVLIGIITNILLNVILVQRMGIEGAAIATMISTIIGAVFYYRYLSRYIFVSIAFREIGWCIVSSLAMTLVIYSLMSLSPISNLVQLFAVIIVGIVTYLTCLGIYSPIRKRAIDQIR